MWQNTRVDRGQLTWNLCCINLSKYVMAGRPEKIGKHTRCMYLAEVEKHVGNVGLRQS